jgi:hypothetical protein
VVILYTTRIRIAASPLLSIAGSGVIRWPSTPVHSPPDWGLVLSTPVYCCARSGFPILPDPGHSLLSPLDALPLTMPRLGIVRSPAFPDLNKVAAVGNGSPHRFPEV